MDASPDGRDKAAFDRDLLLRLRVLASEDAVDLGLCQAQVDVTAPDLSKDGGKSAKGSKDNPRKAANTGGVTAQARPSTEGGSGGTSGTEFPWRRGQSANGEGGSGSAPSGLLESGVAGTGATPTEYPWRRSPPSPELGPQSATAQPPWRKSPQGTSPMPSPSLSTQDPDLPEGALEFEMSIDPDKAEPFSAVTKHASQMAQKDVKEAAQQNAPDCLEGDLDAEEFESGDDEEDEGAEENVRAKDEKQQSTETWKSGWKSSAKKDTGPPLPCDLTMPATPPPPLHALAGTWFDTLGNMIQVPLFPPMAWFTSSSGSTSREISLDKWGRLWCGNGVLHAVGYNSGPMSQDMPPTHLSWRTTAWKFSVWERVAAPPEAPPPPGKGKGAGKEKGRSGGSRRAGGARNNSDKGASGDTGQATAPSRAPELPKLGDFMSFPALGKADPKKKNDPKAQAETPS